MIPLIVLAGIGLLALADVGAYYYSGAMDEATGGAGWIGDPTNTYDQAAFESASRGFGYSMALAGAGLTLAAAPIIPYAANALWASGVASASTSYTLATAGFATAGTMGFLNTASQGANAGLGSVLMQPVGAAFGAYMPTASFLGAGGSVAGGAIDSLGFGGQFVGGRGWNIGGMVGNLAGGGWQYGWRGMIGQGIGGVGGAGLGYYRTGTIDGAIQYANYGTMLGGLGQGALGMLGRSRLFGVKVGRVNPRNHPPGHHSLIPHGGQGKVSLRGILGNQYGRIVPSKIRDSKFNLIGPDSRYLGLFGRFRDRNAYNLWHYRVDPHYYGNQFWRPPAGISKYGLAGRLWHGSPDWLQVGVGGLSLADAALWGYVGYNELVE